MSVNRLFNTQEVLFYIIFTFLISTVDVSLKLSEQSERIFRFPYNSGPDKKPYRHPNDFLFAVLIPAQYCDDAPKIIAGNVLPAVEMGVRRIQENDFLLKNINVTIVFRDTNCSTLYGPFGFAEIYNRHKLINAVFGISREYVLAQTIRFASAWDIPLISTAGMARAFDNKGSNYQTLTRMFGGATHLGRSLKTIFDTFRWKIFSILYEAGDRDNGKSTCTFAASEILSNIYIGGVNANNVQYSDFSRNLNRTAATNMLNTVKNNARIVVMCGNRPSIRQIMLVADELNMIDSGEYVFFNIELFASSPKYVAQPWYDPQDTEENNQRAKKAFTAVLTITAKQPDDEKYLAFSEEIKELAATRYNYTFPKDEPVSPFVTAFYDAVLLYGYALNDTIRDDPMALTKPFNGTELVYRMWNRTFNGITGNVTIDGNGDRITAYSLLDMNPETGRFEIVAHYFYKQLEYVEGRTIHWAGGRLEPPTDKPVCGFDGSLCPDNSLPGYAILSLVLGFTVVLMAIISFLGYRHYKSEAEINSMTWKISWNEVMPCDSGKYRGSMHSIAKRGSQMTLYSEDMGSLPGDRQLFIPVGFYKGCKVAIKKIDENNINLNRSLMLELKRMKDLQHDHLVKFFGACVDPPKCCIFTEYCPKGSLQDILENEQINLDWMFKLSLMHDIVRGMHFLHQSDLKSHGNLKSSNCVVDSRFVLKITDFGLHALRKPTFEDDIENCNSYAYWKRLLWTAPELLRIVNPPPEGTQKADVYSFGIIVHEIITRQGPFFLGHDNKSPEQIVQLVKNYPKGLSQPFRPQVDDSTFDDINNIMVKCWSEDPCERPEFGYLKTTIRKINKDNETGNIVDNLLQRMEQYANNLEGLVEERTRDYLEEKKKCEKLLYQLLPESVAAQLICGQPVIAETYDQVTIYFSDIVGFTAISAESTPMEVVSFLNDLYTCFDSIVENFDVYKVETIGDAYMVVSGLPVRNGNLHAREIARMAIALLNAVKKFTIRHRPNDQLKLRIGLHSGPCVAGVVGLKMPRYCLFGDTVNTASRMESNGEALKIHISQSTKDFLEQFNIFNITKRGYVKMKGKGDMLTYWLNGENDINVINKSFTIGDDNDNDNSLTTSNNLIKNNDNDIILKTDGDNNKQCIENNNDNVHEQLALLTGNGNSPNNIIIPNSNLCNNLSSGSNSNNSNSCNNINNDLTTNNDLINKRNSNSINFNNIVKTNNLKNLKIMCNANEDNVKSVTQPLLAKINS